MKTTYKTVLTIAGSDSSGGAGIQADIKAISANGCYAASVITALTAQNTQGVQDIHTPPIDFIEQQISSVFTDIKIDAVKIGMLYNKAIIDSIVKAIKTYQPTHIVLDPVMVAKDCSLLIQEEVITYLKDILFPLVSLITPNLPETEKLLHEKILTVSDMKIAAKKLGGAYQTNVLVKGGHLQQSVAHDVLYLYQENKFYDYTNEKILTQNTHGTGCTLSSSIAAFLARGEALPNAITQAKQYLTSAIVSGNKIKLGHGHGPVDHFYFLNENERL